MPDIRFFVGLVILAFALTVIGLVAFGEYWTAAGLYIWISILYGLRPSLFIGNEQARPLPQTQHVVDGPH